MSDQTPPNNIEQELRISEARFQAMFETAAIGICIVGSDHKVIDANPVLCRMLRNTYEEIQTMRLEDVIHPEEVAMERDLYSQMMEGKIPYYTVEIRIVRKEGSEFWCRLTNSIVRAPDEKIMFTVGMIEDIDEQRRVLMELQESEARFRTIYDHAEMGIVIANLSQSDRDLQISEDRVMEESLFFHLVQEQRINPALKRMFGYSESELKDMDLAELIYPADRRLDYELGRELFAGKRDSYRIEKRYQRKDGSIFWGRLNYSLVRDADSRPRMAIGIIEDITHEKEAQESFGESEARFRAMFDNTSVGMALMTLNRRVVAVNQAAERIVGYPLGDLSQMDPAELSLPEDRDIGSIEFREMVAGQRQGFQMEKRYLRKDGRVIWARVTYSLVPDRDGKPQYLVGLIEDIDEQKLTGEKLTQQEAEYRKRLEERVEARTHELAEANSRLVKEIEQRQRVEEALAAKAAEDAVVAERTRLARDLHDAVTQTLFSASLIAEVLPDLWTMDAEEARKSTDELRQLTRGALAEMRTLLLELRPAALTQTRFADLMRQLSEALIGRARLPIQLNIDGERSLPPDVQVALYRIAQESLNNIVKYARATRVDVDLILSTTGVHLEITDNGIGFEPLTLKPTSLGMRIMRERAEAISADFSVSSTPGAGTAVSVTWVEG